MIYKKKFKTDNNGDLIFKKDESGSLKPDFIKVKLTPNQYAKNELFDRLESAFYWEERDPNIKDFTESEINQINKQIEKRYYSIKKYLGQ